MILSKKNKNKFIIIIAGNEFEIVSKIAFEEFKKYKINKEEEILTVISIGEIIKDTSFMF